MVCVQLTRLLHTLNRAPASFERFRDTRVASDGLPEALCKRRRCEIVDLGLPANGPPHTHAHEGISELGGRAAVEHD